MYLTKFLLINFFYYSCNLSLLDLLDFAGMRTEAMERIVYEASRHCIASFDVESLCQEVNATSGQEHLCGPPPETISDLRISRQIVGVQQAVLIG